MLIKLSTPHLLFIAFLEMTLRSTTMSLFFSKPLCSIHITATIVTLSLCVPRFHVLTLSISMQLSIELSFSTVPNIIPPDFYAEVATWVLPHKDTNTTSGTLSQDMSSAQPSAPQPFAADSSRLDLNNRPVLKQAIAELPSADLDTSFIPPHKNWQGETCSVCLEDFEADSGQTVMIVPCGHFYHHVCGVEMIVGMQGVSKCAECRAPIFTAAQHDEISRERGATTEGPDASSTLDNIVTRVNEHIESIVLGPWGDAAGVLNLHLVAFSDTFHGILDSFWTWLENVYDHDPTPIESYCLETVVLYVIHRQFRQAYQDLDSFLNDVQARRQLPRPQLESFEELLNAVGTRTPHELIVIENPRPVSVFDIVPPYHSNRYSVICRPFEILMDITTRLETVVATARFTNLPDSANAELREIFYRIGDAMHAFVTLARPALGLGGPGRALRERREAIAVAQRELAREVEDIYRDLVGFFLRTERALSIERPVGFPENILNLVSRGDAPNRPANPRWAEETVGSLRDFREARPHLVRPSPSSASRGSLLIGMWRWRNRGVLRRFNFHPLPSDDAR